MHRDELKERTKRFALEVVSFVGGLPPSYESKVFGSQLVRSASSVGGNYRAACRSRSRAEFVAKIGIVVEEADESGYWLELIRESIGSKTDKLLSESEELLKEANELTAIFVASRKTAQSSKQQ